MPVERFSMVQGCTCTIEPASGGFKDKEKSRSKIGRAKVKVMTVPIAMTGIMIFAKSQLSANLFFKDVICNSCVL